MRPVWPPELFLAVDVLGLVDHFFDVGIKRIVS